MACSTRCKYGNIVSHRPETGPRLRGSAFTSRLQYLAAALKHRSCIGLLELRSARVWTLIRSAGIPIVPPSMQMTKGLFLHLVHHRLRKGESGPHSSDEPAMCPARRPEDRRPAFELGAGDHVRQCGRQILHRHYLHARTVAPHRLPVGKMA